MNSIQFKSESTDPNRGNGRARGDETGTDPHVHAAHKQQTGLPRAERQHKSASELSGGYPQPKGSPPVKY